MKYVLVIIITLLVLALLLYWTLYLGLQPTFVKKISSQINTSRITDGPIIYKDLDQRLIQEADTYGYTNINGPSLIKVPSWVSKPLGKYYLYFAHHKGSHIKMAYADDILGPWKLYEKDILQLSHATMSTNTQPESGWNELRKYTSWTEAMAIVQVGKDAKAAYEKRLKEKIKSSPPTTPHIASPEIFIDSDSQQIRMYFHGVVEGNIQMTKVATSSDGLFFEARDKVLGLPYMRVFKHNNLYYALSMPGILYRSKDGLTDFEVRKKWLFDTKTRHSAILKRGSILYVFYSRVGDAPERILCSSIDLSSEDWKKWEASSPIEVVRPEFEWEGVNEPIQPSMRGEMGVLVHQLRDPYIYQEAENLYLLYSGGGEQNIGLRKLSL